MIQFSRKIVLLAALATAMAACGTAERAPNDALRVGVILPLTGTLAEMGFYERKAMELASSRSASSSIQLLFEDSKSTAAGAASAANKLISADRVDAIVASTTGGALAVQPIAEAASLPLIAFCMDPTITANHGSTVRFYIGIEEETKEVLDFMSTLPKGERVAVLHAAVPVWRKIVESTYVPRLTAMFGVPPLVEEYSLQNRDFRPALGKLAAGRVTTLVILGYGFEYPPLFQQLDELNLRSRIQRLVGGWGFLYSSLPAPQLEGIIVAGPRYVFDRTDRGAAFATEFKSYAGREANFDAAFAFELVDTLPMLRTANSLTATSIKAGLRQLGKRTGVVGEYEFTERGDMIVDTGLGQFRNGVLQPYAK